MTKTKHHFKIEIPKKFVKYFVIAVAALIAVAYIITAAKFTLFDFGLLVAFILIGAAGRLLERLMPIALGIELISTFTIVSAIKYGSLAGAVVGSTAFILSSFYTYERPQDVLIAIFGFVGVAFFAPAAHAFFGHNLGAMSIALTVGYDAFTGSFYYFSHSLASVVRFSVVHIVANYFIMVYLGAKLLGL